MRKVVVHPTVGKRFRKNLSRLRAKRQLGVRELAGKMGISHVYVSLLERGVGGRQPSMEMLEKFAKALSVDVSELIKE